MATRVLVPEWMSGHDAWIGVLGKSNMVGMDSISSSPFLRLAWGGVEAGQGGPESAAQRAAGRSGGRGGGGGSPPGEECRLGSPRPTPLG